MLFQKSWVHFPQVTGWLITICYTGHPGADTSGLRGTAHTVHIHACKQSTHNMGMEVKKKSTQALLSSTREMSLLTQHLSTGPGSLFLGCWSYFFSGFPNSTFCIYLMLLQLSPPASPRTPTYRMTSDINMLVTIKVPFLTHTLSPPACWQPPCKSSPYILVCSEHSAGPFPQSQQMAHSAILCARIL